ncbi:MAG: AraC family transcriptional regulator [Altererythrobacter sp.]|nr:AraC family transcriptional regulator [Altererythrobacter sp.]NNE50649.1 AraC family transcriptional regulator [Altererythrobacter sp.]
MAGSHWLAMPPHFTLEYFDPPATLERHVLTLFYFVWDEEDIRERHPGALPQLTLFPHGQGEVSFSDRPEHFSGDAHMLSGFSTAVPYRIKGPWHAIGASLSPLGWAALAGQPAGKWLDRFYPAKDILGEQIEVFAKGINSRYRAGQLTGEVACNELARWIEPRLGQVPQAHELLIQQTVAWLGHSLRPNIEELFASLNYSRRQAERLVERYFGFPPAALARKHRAIRAASLLAEEAISDEQEAEIAEAFYDQPHLVREIRRYCGYTPTRLGGSQEPLFLTMLRMKNLDRLRKTTQRSNAKR